MLEKLKNRSLLFVEDNDLFAQNTKVLLNMFVKQVFHAYTIEEAQELYDSNKIDLIICDIKLKNENGLDFIKKVRETNPYIPIMVLSGHKDEKFLLRSIPLDLSAYMLKPIKYNELMDALQECAKKLLRHTKKNITLKEGWIFDTEKKSLIKGDKEYSLSKKEVLFFELLTQNSDRLITKDMLYATVWEFEEMTDSAVTNFILRIRKRFGKTFIYTIPNLGYRLNL